MNNEHLQEILHKCRMLLKDVTPLKNDCGRLCGAKCCSDVDGDSTGMLLFPGEKELYCGSDFMQIRPAEYEIAGTAALIGYCHGLCPRDLRPLSCMIFPLTYVIHNGALTVEMNAESLGICPLSYMRIDALSKDFVDAVLDAGQIMYSSKIYHPFIDFLSSRQLDMLALRGHFVK